jgi:hypothetical protein
MKAVYPAGGLISGGVGGAVMGCAEAGRVIPIRMAAMPAAWKYGKFRFIDFPFKLISVAGTENSQFNFAD